MLDEKGWFAAKMTTANLRLTHMMTVIGGCKSPSTGVLRRKTERSAQAGSRQKRVNWA